MSSQDENAATGPAHRAGGVDRQSTGRGSWVVGCVGAVIGGLVVFALLVLVFFGGIALLVMAGAGMGGQAGPQRVLRERTISGTRGDPKVAVIPVRGILVPGGSGLERDPRALFEAMLDRARADSQVRGVILAVESGGGAITTCDIMYKELKDYRSETGEPVVVLMGDIAASGAYYISCAADRILAHPTTITGSIGVKMPVYSASGLLDKIGLEDRSLATGPFKDIASPTAEKTPEEWQREKELLTGIIGQMHERFVQVVAEGRGLEPGQVRSLADGRIFTTEQARENGLIDDVGYLEDAVDAVRQAGDLPAPHVVEYGRMPGLAELLLTHASKPEVTVRLDRPSDAARRRPMYLWAP